MITCFHQDITTRGEYILSQLKNITMIFNGKPSEESFKNFVRLVNEVAKDIKLKEEDLIKTSNSNIEEKRK